MDEDLPRVQPTDWIKHPAAGPNFEHVGYRYRPGPDAENVPMIHSGDWEYAPASQTADMESVAEKGWQVERLYRRCEDASE